MAEQRSANSSIVLFWRCLEDAQQARTPDSVKFQSTARMTMDIVKNIAGKRDSPIRVLAKKACVLVYVLLDNPETLHDISQDRVIDYAGDLQGTLGTIGNMVDRSSRLDSLRFWETGEREQNIRDCEEVLNDIISRCDSSEFKSKTEVVNRTTQDRGLLDSLLSQPRLGDTGVRESFQVTPAAINRGRQDEGTPQEDPPPHPEEYIDRSGRRNPFLVYRESQHVVDASHHTTNTNSGNTRVTTTTNSNNNSSVRVYGDPRHRAQRY